MKIETMVLGPLETNCYLLWDEKTNEAAVIDPGAGGEKIAGRLEELGLKLRYILLTHAHFDHIGGVKALHTRTGAPIYVSTADSTDPMEMAHGRLMFTDTYDEGDELTLGGIRIRVMATPGHTPGGACLLVGDVIFSGDTLFAGCCGRTDFKGGSEEEMLHSLRRLGELPGDRRVLPGHMEQTTLERERMYNPWMREAMRR